MEDRGIQVTKKRWLAIGIALAIFVFSAGFSLMRAFVLKDSKETFSSLFFTESDFYEEVIEEGNPLKKIVVLDVDGVIIDTGEDSFVGTASYNHRSFMNKLEAIGKDPSVKGVVIRVNSPGGGTVESAEIHDKLKEMTEEKNIPVYISMGSIAASGGYYISAPATKIFASKETITGSIGVILQSYNIAELADKLGIDANVIKSGPHKDIMSSMREMTDEEREILQEMIDNAYDDFVKIIAEGREMPESKVRELADGRIFDGRQAKELGLIDEFGYFKDTIAAIKEEQNLDDAYVVRYKDQAFTFGSLLWSSAKNLTGRDHSAEALLNLLTSSNAPRLMYLYSN